MTNSSVLHGELYIAPDGEAHFVRHTPDNMTLGDIREATVKFIALLENRLDRDDEDPVRTVLDAPTAPDSYDKQVLENRLTPREERRVSNAIGLAQEQERHPAVLALLKYFRWQHLPDHLAAVSKPFSELACTLANTLPSNPETTVALRKLLESKDCAVRSALDWMDR